MTVAKSEVVMDNATHTTLLSGCAQMEKMEMGKYKGHWWKESLPTNLHDHGVTKRNPRPPNLKHILPSICLCHLGNGFNPSQPSVSHL